jgi:hypothetical protein
MGEPGEHISGFSLSLSLEKGLVDHSWLQSSKEE